MAASLQLGSGGRAAQRYVSVPLGPLWSSPPLSGAEDRPTGDLIQGRASARLCFEPAALHCASNSVNYLKLCSFPKM